MDIRQLTALELGKLIKEKSVSSPEAVRAYIDAAKRDIEKPGGDATKLNAYTEVLEESALAAAEAVQAQIDKREILSPLAGVPVALKDNICTKGGLTTAGSKILKGFRSPYDAAIAERLMAAGAVIIGKTNMDEFGMGTSTETSCYGPTRNPWDMERVPGGSSGGSAAAVAAGLAPYAIGSDTGGSLRQPCSFCNLTGIKPTYGSVPRFGEVALAPSLDQMGPLAQDARDCAVILSIISGKDERDSMSTIDEPFKPCEMMHSPGGAGGDVRAGVAAGTGGVAGVAGSPGGAQADGKGAEPAGCLDGLKIGLPTNYFDMKVLNSDVKARVLEAAETLRSLGAEIVEFTLPLIEYAMPAYLVLSCAEASSCLARYDGVKYGHRSETANTVDDIYYMTRGEGLGTEVKRRIMLGSFVLSSGYYNEYYRKALKMRGLIREAFDAAFQGMDLILAPVCPTTAFDIGGRIEDPLAMYDGDTYTASVNLAGLPAAAAPCGFGDGGLPVGMQLIGKAWSEGLILGTIARYQQVTDHHKKRPIQEGVWDAGGR